MAYEGLLHIQTDAAPHLGGNIKEGDPFCFAPSAWDYLIRRFALKSVMDLGSGTGHAADYFFRAGLAVLAVEGLKANVVNSTYPAILLDLTQAAVTCRVDLVHCQEVVEHIDERHLENLLHSLACGRFVVMTHALPGQGGHHHVNEKPAEYWIAHLRRYNCELLEEDTRRLRALAAADGAGYLAATGMVLANRSR